MLTKGAMGNLINRYRAVLKKCNLINTFGSLAIASMLVLGGTGVAMASVDVALNGQNNVDAGFTGSTTNLIGGWLVKDSGVTVEAGKDVTTTLNGVNVSEIIGGSYAKGKKATAQTIEHGSISLTIDSAESTATSSAVEFVVGGSKVANSKNVNLKSGDIALTINNGTFGKDGGNSYELVTGGNYIKSNTATLNNDAKADDVSVTVNGGTFYATVVGGSTAHEYSDTASNTTLYVRDMSTSVTINGGTFTPSDGTGRGELDLDAAIIGGGMAYAKSGVIYADSVSSNVAGNSSVTINGGTINGKVVAGGYSHNGGTAFVEGDTFLSMTGGTVKGDLVGGGLVNGGAGVSHVYGSTNISVTGGSLVDAEIIGGGYVRNSFGSAQVENTNVTVKHHAETLDKQNWVQYVMGGGKAMTNGDYRADASVTETTNVTIALADSENIQYGAVIGGGLARTQGKGGNAVADVLESSNVTINSGKLSGVAGGGVAESFSKVAATANAEVAIANTTINGGSIEAITYKGTDAGNTAVLGGGIAYVKEGTVGTSDAYVDTVNLTINGGTISGDVYAGGMADGTGATANVDTANLTINGGNISGSVYADRGFEVADGEAKVGNATLTIGGDVTIEETLYAENTQVNFESGSLSVGEESQVAGASINVSGGVNDSLQGSPDALAKQFGYESAEKLSTALDNGSLAMEEGLIAGAVTRNADGSFTTKTNTVLSDTLEQATAAPLAVNRILMNDVRKRMGDLRSDKNESGVWMRWDGGKLAGDNGLSNNFNTLQIGGDTKVAKNCRFGVAGSFTHGDIDHNNGGGEMESYTFAAYGTWMAESGMFADVIARVGFTNSEIMAKGGKADIDNEALSLSAEYGWRLPVGDQFFIEPQVELTYTHVTGADFTIKTAKYDIDSVDSLLGRAGLVAGWNLPNDMGNVYARASVVHEFLGDSKISATNNGGFATHKLDGDDTWLEYGIGANVKLTDKTYIWADVERTEGADLDEEWRGTVGLRYSF